MYSLILKKINTVVANTILVLSFAFLMILSSQVKIPLFFTPVPITFQTFILFLSLSVLKKKAFLSYGVYLMLGIGGLPVFANGGSGVLYLFGPTGGYLAGFFLSAFIFGYLIDKKENFKRKSMIYYWKTFFMTNLLIYFCGIGWLIVSYGFSFNNAFSIGIIPFIIPDVIKIILAGFLSCKLIRKC